MTYLTPSGKRYRRSRKKGRLIFVSLLSIGIILGAAFGTYRLLSSRNSPMEDPAKELPKVEASTDKASSTASAVIVLTSSPDIGGKPVGKRIKIESPSTKTGFWIRIEKGKFSLSLMQGGKIAGTFPVALGKNEGNKEKAGDMRTPEGVFSVERVQDSSAWVHDFGDGKGPIAGAYGPKFIRLQTGWSGIGIHGTHDVTSIGKKVTEGCIRLKNEDLAELVPFVKAGMKVQIDP